MIFFSSIRKDGIFSRNIILSFRWKIQDDLSRKNEIMEIYIFSIFGSDGMLLPLCQKSKDDLLEKINSVSFFKIKLLVEKPHEGETFSTSQKLKTHNPKTWKHIHKIFST